MGWQINVRKKLKACGEKHVNSVKKVVPKRTVGAPCTCRLKCFDKINEAQRTSILSSFNELGNKEKQYLYLGGLISLKPVGRKRPTTGQRNGKEISFSYKVCYPARYFIFINLVSFCQYEYKSMKIPLGAKFIIVNVWLKIFFVTDSTN